MTNKNLAAIVVTVSNKAYRTGEIMTRKDYELIAKAIKSINDGIVYLNNETIDSRYVSKVLDILVHDELEQVFKTDNPRFNSKRFREACGL